MIFQEDLPCLSSGFLPQCGDSMGVHNFSPVARNASPYPGVSKDKCGDTLKLEKRKKLNSGLQHLLLSREERKDLCIPKEYLMLRNQAS